MNRMTATILSGKAMAKEIEAELAEQVADFVQNNGVTPCLAAVLVGEDPASGVYVRNKRLACERVGLESRMHKLPVETTEEELLELVAELNADERCMASWCNCRCPSTFARPRFWTPCIRSRMSIASIRKTSAC